MLTRLAHQSTPLSRKELCDLKLLAQFTSIYCRAHHAEAKQVLAMDDSIWLGMNLKKFPVCQACREFLCYAFERRMNCPLDVKPACKHCQIHCFKPGHREQVREIMRFSGQYLIKRGRLDLLWRYWF